MTTRPESGNLERGQTGRADVSAFDVWVAANNPRPELEYDKGFWDYVEIIRRLVSKFEGTGERVIGTYIVNTPPPEEELPMPAVTFEVGKVAFALKWDFGALARWPNEWTVSVRRPVPYVGSVFALFREDVDLSERPIPGFGDEWTFPSFRMSPLAFTCDLEDEWDVAALIRLMCKT